MTDVEPCECCGLTIGCGRAAEKRAREERDRERRRLLSQPGARPAAFFGRCGTCDEQYGIGAIIGPPAVYGQPWIGPCCLGSKT